MKGFVKAVLLLGSGLIASVAHADCNQEALLYQSVISLREKGVPEAKAIFLVPELSRDAGNQIILRKAIVDAYERFPNLGVVPLVSKVKRECQSSEQSAESAAPELELQFQGARQAKSVVGTWACKGSEGKFVTRTYTPEGLVTMDIAKEKALLKGTYSIGDNHITESYTSLIDHGKSSAIKTSGRMSLAFISSDQSGVVDESHFLCVRRDSM